MQRPARSRPRTIFFGAGNTFGRMNYPAIACHVAGRGHAVSIEAVEDPRCRTTMSGR